MGKLTAKQVAATTTPCAIGDGDGLWFQVGGPTQRSWIMRYTSPVTRRTREFGLGSYPAVSLAQAREARDAARVLIRGGKDPIDERKARALPVDVTRGMTFRAAMEATIKARTPSWTDPKAPDTWRNSLSRHAASLLDKHCREITTADVHAVLEPIWSTMAPTAKHIRERIETILDYAAMMDGWADDKPNPARWKGRLSVLLPKIGAVHTPEHHASLPHADAPAFFADLRQREGAGARALELTILTGQRTGAIMAAKWADFDLTAKVWNCPAEDMKAKEAHTVPLTPAMLRVLEAVKPLRRQDRGDWVFPGQGKAGHISNGAMTAVLKRMGRAALTVHGFRSTIRDWAGEKTAHADVVAEAVLDHVLPGGATRAAYQRGDLLTKRRRLHEDWEKYLGA